jgi:secreted trypsin-like serine protease
MMIRGLLLLLVIYTGALAQERVINGTVVSASNENWQSIVSFRSYGYHICGGTLIAPTWVLTASHCLEDNYGNPISASPQYTIGVGSYSLSSMTLYSPKRFIRHPAYNTSTLNNDIALIELESAVTMVEPTHYDTDHSLASNTQTEVAGWGNMSTTGSDYPNDLREALVPIVDTATCNGFSAYNGSITSNMLCAGYMVSYKDSCQGDSGGPLMVDETLVGIVSWGYGCAQTGYPGVYTKVQNYASWIKSYTPYEVRKQSGVEAVIPVISMLLSS